MSPHQSVLDVGACGLAGENTTNMLFAHFDEVLGINTKEVHVIEYREQYPERDVLVQDYYTMDPTSFGQFNVVVLDLTIELNLKDWSDDGLAYAKQFVEPGGTLINYVMMTQEYGEDETHERIATHWREWWGSDEYTEEAVEKKIAPRKDFRIIGMEREERRPYIVWVALQRIDG